MHWLELIVEIDGTHADAASELLDAGGAVAVTFNENPATPVLEPAPGSTPLWDRLTLVALFDPGIDTTAVEASLEALPRGALAGSCVWKPLADRDWSREWLKDYAPMCFGERLWVAPAGMPPPDPDAPAIVMDPGLAFGTGSHETTALCLDWVASRRWQNEHIMDYGCGSGILALAALRLGAGDAVALDIDPQALTATAQNARVNGLAERIKTVASAGTETFDVVLANILAGPLLALAPALSAMLRDSGDLVLSGLLASQAESLIKAYEPWIVFEPPRLRGDWALLYGKRLPQA